MNTMTLTRFNQTAKGYTKRSDQQIELTQAGEDSLNHLIQEGREAKHPARAWSFSSFEDGEMSGATYYHSSALILDYAAGSDFNASVTEIVLAAKKLGIGYYVIDAQDRYKQRSIALVIPLTQTITKDRYARLVYVLLEEMKANGCSHSLMKHTSAMTHLIHLHDRSEATWVQGPVLNPIQKIRATRTGAQDMERDRFSIGARAAALQLAKPVLTACDPGLFEGL